MEKLLLIWGWMVVGQVDICRPLPPRDPQEYTIAMHQFTLDGGCPTRTQGELLKPTLLQATSIIDSDSNQRRLRLKEALHILRLKPSLNVTQETFLLPTNIRRNRPAAERIPAAEGTVVRGPEPERAPAIILTNQRPGRREDAASQNVLDLPAAPVRRSTRIQQLAATQ